MKPRTIMHALKTHAYQNWLDSGKYALKVSPFHAKEYEHVEMIEMSAYTALLAHAQELAEVIRLFMSKGVTDHTILEAIRVQELWHSFEKQLKNEK